MSDFNREIDAAHRRGRLEGLRIACADSVCELHPSLAPRLVPLIRRERDLDRLVEWTVASGRLSRTAFAALFSGM
jgi:hypothetical protein